MKRPKIWAGMAEIIFTVYLLFGRLGLWQPSKFLTLGKLEKTSFNQEYHPVSCVLTQVLAGPQSLPEEKLGVSPWFSSTEWPCWQLFQHSRQTSSPLLWPHEGWLSETTEPKQGVLGTVVGSLMYGVLSVLGLRLPQRVLGSILVFNGKHMQLVSCVNFGQWPLFSNIFCNSIYFAQFFRD